MKRVPRFNCEQMVRFVGGQGKIKAYHPESGSWQYMVEMEMGPEPDMGRIGYETTVVLLESDLIAV
ncbi:hypothetical protein [Leptolyngbya ohadii]|uniref:hypothetical protein n=1 Tax=Leptolyngbya ohadii TaxID=1962290 RepID=UPI000B599D11|nr:hypothetical protein [Leptolyngbya ohadii]